MPRGVGKDPAPCGTAEGGPGPERARRGGLTGRGLAGPASFAACLLSSASFAWQVRHQPPRPARSDCPGSARLAAPAPSGGGRLAQRSSSAAGGSLLRGESSSESGGGGCRPGLPSATCGDTAGSGRAAAPQPARHRLAGRLSQPVPPGLPAAESMAPGGPPRPRPRPRGWSRLRLSRAAHGAAAARRAGLVGVPGPRPLAAT